MGEIRLFIVMSVLCVVGMIVLALGHPGEYSFIPRCPFYSMTGCYCPGCGSLRSTHFLLQGNLAASLRYHPLLIPLLLFLVFLYFKRLYEMFLGRNVLFKRELFLCKIVVMIWIAFFLVRNIPIDSLEWTRPPEPTTVSVEKQANH